MDWSALIKAVWSVALLVIGAGLQKLLERKPHVTYYVGPWSAFVGSSPTTFHTHWIVIKNLGKKSATDVRVRHELRTETFYVIPQIPHSDPDMPGGGFEIVFPRLVPQEEVAISYMHSQPFNNFRGQITHADGSAVEAAAILRPGYPAWLTSLVVLLALVGLIAILFVAIVVGSRAVGWNG